MSSRAWIAAVAFGLIASGALAQEPQQPTPQREPERAAEQQEAASARQEDATPEQGGAAQLLPALQDIKAAIRELIAEEDKISAEEDRRRDQADLKAQESMALWAFWMFVAAVASVVATFVGLALIGRTLHHTRRAADYTADMVAEAKATTKAAQDAVTVTRDIGEAQTRAYLYCKEAKYKLSREDISAVVTLGNAGQSPASDVHIEGTATITWVAGPAERPRTISWIASDTAMMMFQPLNANGQSTEEITFFYDYHFATQIEEGEEESRQAAWTDGNEVTFDFVVHWRDVFGGKHQFNVSLFAIYGPSPYNPRKRRTNTGKLDFRMEDARLRVAADHPEETTGE